VLSGAVTVSQLRSNLNALDGDVPDMDRFAALAVDPNLYWSQRAAMRWT
jgi:hypothetical protein